MRIIGHEGGHAMKLLSVNVSSPKEVPYPNKTTGMRRVEEPDSALSPDHSTCYFKALSVCKRFRKVEISHQKPLEETYEKVINECRGGDNATRWVCPDRGSCECSNVIEPSNHSPNLD